MQYIRDIMTPNPKTCHLDHSITCALDIMKSRSCGAVPIVDSAKKLHGIITDRDIALCLNNNPTKTVSDLTVKDCIKHVGDIITINPDDDLHKAVMLMEKNQVRRLPVVDEQMHCVGIVAQADIVLKDKSPQETLELVQEISKQKRASIGANP